MTVVRFLPAAELELLREVAYYAEARNGIGLRFQDRASAQELLIVAVAHHRKAPGYRATRVA